MKGILGSFRKRKGSGSDQTAATIPPSPELVALKPDLGAGQNATATGTVGDPAKMGKPEETQTTPDPALSNAAKASPTRHDVAVLSIAESGEILSARGSCLTVFGADCSALAGKNISAFLKGGLDNEVGQFLRERRTGTKTTDTLVLKVSILRPDGGLFPASVTTPTWSLGTRLTQTSDTSHLGWTLAFRGLSIAPQSPSSAESKFVGEPEQGERQPPNLQSQFADAKGESLDQETQHKATQAPAKVSKANGEDWFDSDDAGRRPDGPAEPPAQAANQEAGMAAARPQAPASERVWLHRHAIEESNRRVEELQCRLVQKTNELEQVTREVEKQKADRDRAESQWRSELDTVTKALGEKLQTATIGGHAREKQTQEELAAIRLERDELKRKLVGHRELEKAAEAPQHEDRSRVEFELRSKLEAARETAGYTEAALKDEALKRERLEQINANLRKEQTESCKRYESELIQLRDERQKLETRLGAVQEVSEISQRRVEQLEGRLGQNKAELDRVREELEKRGGERQGTESEVARRLRRETDNAEERPDGRIKNLEEQNERLRGESEDLKRQLDAERKATAESKQRCGQLGDQLLGATKDNERLHAELRDGSADREKREADLREQLDTARSSASNTKTALKEESLRREEFERLSTSMRLEQFEISQKFEEELAKARQARATAQENLRLEREAMALLRQRCVELEAGRETAVGESDRIRSEMTLCVEERNATEAALCRDLESAKNARSKAEDALGNAEARTRHLESEVIGLRGECGSLRETLESERRGGADFKQRINDLQRRLDESMAELDRVRAESAERMAECGRLESEWQQQMAALKGERQRNGGELNDAVQRNKALEEEVGRLQNECSELSGKVAEGIHAASAANRRTELAERKVSQMEIEVTRWQAELKEQTVEKERLEAQLHQQSNAVVSRKEKLEAAWSDATKRNKELEAEVASMRHQHDQLNEESAKHHRAAIEGNRRAEAAERRLAQSAAELERIKADLQNESVERVAAESEWRDQLAASKALTKKLETAWMNAVERHKLALAELDTVRKEREELLEKLVVEAPERRVDSFERPVSQHALEGGVVKRGNEELSLEQARLKTAKQGISSTLREKTLAGPGVTPAEAGKNAGGNPYRPPGILSQQYNLQP